MKYQRYANAREALAAHYATSNKLWDKYQTLNAIYAANKARRDALMWAWWRDVCRSEERLWPWQKQMFVDGGPQS